MSIGIWQIVLILVIVLIIFGAGKLPRIMGDLAKGVRSFKTGLSEDSPDAAKDSPPASTRDSVSTTEPPARKDEAKG